MNYSSAGKARKTQREEEVRLSDVAIMSKCLSKGADVKGWPGFWISYPLTARQSASTSPSNGCLQ